MSEIREDMVNLGLWIINACLGTFLGTFLVALSLGSWNVKRRVSAKFSVFPKSGYRVIPDRRVQRCKMIRDPRRVGGLEEVSFIGLYLNPDKDRSVRCDYGSGGGRWNSPPRCTARGKAAWCYPTTNHNQGK